MTIYGLGTYGALGGTYGGGTPAGSAEPGSTVNAPQGTTIAASGAEATSTTAMPGG